MMEPAALAELTPKAIRTRQHILDTALRLFATRGYHQTTLRDIAAEAKVSLGLTYRYFGQKEELVTAVYEKCSEDLTHEVAELSSGTIAKRFVKTLRTNFERLAPYHETLAAIAGVALNPHPDAGGLSEKTGYMRTRVWRIFREVIAGAKDAPNERDIDHMTTLFYAAYLAIMLFWVQDRSPGQLSTEKMLEFVEETIGRLRPLLKLPVFSKSVAKMATIMGPMFGSSTPNQSTH